MRQTFLSGPQRSSSGWFIYARIWRRIWELIADIGLENVDVRWIPAHTSAQAVADGRLTGLQRICNAKADTLATLGAAIHPHDESVAERTVRTRRVVRHVDRSIGKMNALVGHRTPRDTTAKRESDRRCEQPRAQRASKVAGSHVTIFAGNRHRCNICLRSALTRSSMAQLPCRSEGIRSPHTLRTVEAIIVLFSMRCLQLWQDTRFA